MGRAENLGCGVGQLPNSSSIDFMRLSPRSYTSAATSSQSGWLMTSFARRFVLAMMQVTTSPPESGQGDTVEYPDRNSSNFTSKSGRSQQVRSDEHTPRLSVFPPAPDMRHNDHFVQRIRSMPVWMSRGFLGVFVRPGFRRGSVVGRRLGVSQGWLSGRADGSGCNAGHARDRDVPECPPGPNAVVGRFGGGGRRRRRGAVSTPGSLPSSTCLPPACVHRTPGLGCSSSAAG